MKVLNCFLDNRSGGPQKRAYDIALELKKYGVETVFLFNEKLKASIPINDFYCFLLRHIQCINKKNPITNLLFFCFMFPYNLYKIRRIIKDNKIDIICANGLFNIVPVLAGRLAGRKILWLFEDTLTPPVLKVLFLPFVNLLSNKIIVVSNKVGEYFFGTNRRFLDRTVTIYPPVNIDKFSPNSIDSCELKDIEAEFNISNKDFLIGSVGNVNRSKGYEYFIEAAKLIKEKKANVKFLIVGAKLNTQQRYWQKLQDLTTHMGLKNQILFTGFRNDIAKILPLLDVFVLSSVTEGCPIVILEAMAMEVPVVATNVGGVVEQVINGKSGIVVEPQRPDLLAQGILKIANLPKEALEKMTNEGRRRVEEIFSLPIIAEKYNKIYKNLVCDIQTSRSCRSCQ